MIEIKNPSDCSGCTACASACNHNAISMQPDALGFLYPVIDRDKCTDCGLCERVCAFNSEYDTSNNFNEPLCFGVRHKDINEVETSRSGAAFIAISDWILENNGVVYGAGYENFFRVVHKRAITKVERDEFKGSKYVQSDLNIVFRQVKKDLKDGLIVLFSGTSCQTAGLRSYIGNKLSENLYLLDIICHGVPSPYIWRDYLHYLEKQFGDKISSVNFRDKSSLGWYAHKETIEFSSGERSTRSGYTHLFYQDIMLRKSCGKCYYANTNRPSDLTIADFWGWEKTNAEINLDNKGISLVLCNTSKGLRLFKQIENSLHYFSATLVNSMQPNLKRPTPLNPNTDKFYNDYKEKGFEYVYNKYGEDGWRYKICKFCNNILKLPVRIVRKIKLKI